MTLAAFVLSVILGTGSLAYGYSQMGLTNPTRWFVLLGILWLVAQWRKYYWFSSLALFVIIIAAAFGVWVEFPIIWMLLGALGGFKYGGRHGAGVAGGLPDLDVGPRGSRDASPEGAVQGELLHGIGGPGNRRFL